MTDLTLDKFKSDLQRLIIRYNKVKLQEHLDNLINTYYSHIKDECTEYLQSRMEENSHRTHCCVKHGCKYGDDERHVVTRKIEQDYLCEECRLTGITRLSQLVDTDYIHIKRISAIGNSCNFCDRGVIGDLGATLIYPYNEVTIVETQGSGVSVRMCDDCIKELITKTKKYIK